VIPRDLGSIASERFRHYPIVTITGPRQSGKTTLCRMTFPALPYVSLEAPDHRQRATEDPRAFLADYPDGAILDEIQRAPQLPSYLQVLCDERGRNGQFVLTGSHNLTLLPQLSQSLAGRTSLLYLLPPARNELDRFGDAPPQLDQALFTGAYPRIFDQKMDAAPWLADYVTTYVERDVRQVLNISDLVAFRTFLALLAGRAGQLLNLQSLGADAGVDAKTAKAWIGALETSFLVFRLRPFFRNIRKRLVRTPKLFFVDTGILCHLLGIRSAAELRTHPSRGAVFENWVVSEVLKARFHRGLDDNLFFYRDRSGHEVDLLLLSAGRITAVEAKAGATLASDFVDGLRWFESLVAERSPADRVETVLVYGGDQRREMGGATVLPWHSIHDMDWAATPPTAPPRTRTPPSGAGPGASP
jgi:predicted AAA+ superfamily ATPase